MVEHEKLYDLIYALAARDGRDQALFGNCAALAHEAFTRSMATDAFPELWFELPLAGQPWFDLHALTARTDVSPESSFADERCGGHAEIFTWFAQSIDTRQLALSYDVSSGTIDEPAVQLLMDRRNDQVVCDFLATAGRADAAKGYRAFVKRLPREWYPCYSGVFPGRTMQGMRVECIPPTRLQRGYAQDASPLKAQLAELGLSIDDTTAERLRLLAGTPHHLEFQFDVDKDGRAGAVFSASLRFPPYREGGWEPYDVDGPAGELMRIIESWGLVDDRWRTLQKTAFANRLTQNGASRLLYCFPAFIKLKWRDSEPVDAKAYLMAGTQ